MTDKGTTGKSVVEKETDKVFFKPYRIKPVEVYAEPGPVECTREKTN